MPRSGKRGPGGNPPGLFIQGSLGFPADAPASSTGGLEGVCGLDEAGRGPLAGPVCAAAVILPPGFPEDILDDSKRLNAARREAAFERIVAEARWGIGWAGPSEIDRYNILQASLLAMRRAFADLLSDGLPPPPRAIVDGNKDPGLGVPTAAKPKADAIYPPVMAASIIAKTARDADMVRWSRIYPGYGYEIHKGYPTEAHRAAVARLGPSPIQRMSFKC